MGFNTLVSALVISVLTLTATADPDRVWGGVVSVSPGNEIGMEFRLIQDEAGASVGHLSIPAQGVNRIQVVKLAVSDDAIAFVLAMEGLPEQMRPSFDLTLTPDGSLEGTMTQSGMTFPAVFDLTDDETLQAQKDESRPQTPKPPFEYRTEDVTVPVQTEKWDHTLAGTLSLPNKEDFGEGPYPTLVFITGSGAQDRDETIFQHKPFAVLADHLARKGIASLRCDDRGVFGSTGDPINPTTLDFVDDARAQVKFLTTRQTTGPIGVIGHSEGGLIGPMLAADDDRVKFVVMLAGTGVPGDEILLEQTAAILLASDIAPDRVTEARAAQAELLSRVKAGEDIATLRDLIIKQIQFQTPVKLPDDVLGSAADGAIAQLSVPWMGTFLKIDPRDYLKRLTQPVLVLNGDKDLQVLSWQNIPEIEKALSENTDVTVRVFEGMNHLFQSCEFGTVGEYTQIKATIEPEVLELISTWILERFEH